MQRRRHIVILLLLIGLSVSAVLVLYSFYFTRETRNGGFTRKVVIDALTDSLVTSLPFNSYYLAGAVGDTVFLGNDTAPTHLLLVTDSILVTRTIQAPDPLPRVTRILVDSPFVYMQDLERYSIHSGLLTSLKISRSLQSEFFSETISLSPVSIVQRRLSDKSPEYVLTKLTNEGQAFKYSLLEKQIDGLFCTDGMLRYDKVSRKLIYVYFYRNQFICTDTSLNLLFRHHTIDTVTKANIEVAKIASDDAVILSSPPFIVNRRSAIFDNRLYINSNILSDLEDQRNLDNNCVIDVYDLAESGSYLYSFYLPDFLGHKMKYFMIYQDQLLSIHDHYLIRYRLRIRT